MKRLFFILILFPLLSFAQKDTDNIVYQKVFVVNDNIGKELIGYNRQFVEQNKEKFFSLFAYSNNALPDTLRKNSHYGFDKIIKDTVFAHCLWIYDESKRGSYAILKGEIAFVSESQTAKVILRNLYYSEYIYKNDSFQLKENGDYNKLPICKHCTAAGIKISEFVNDNFARLCVNYHQYLKRIEKHK